MTVFNTAYDTTVGKGFITTKIMDSVKECIIKDSMMTWYSIINSDPDSNIKTILIANQTTTLATIPYFTHPIVIELGTLKHANKTKLLCTDIRSFAHIPKDSVEYFTIKNKMEFDLAKLRTVLNLDWLVENPYRLRDISFVPAAIYSSWISENIARRFALDPKDQYKLAILSCIFYQSLFDNLGMKDSEIHRIAGATVKATKAAAKDVYDVLDKIEELNNIKDFCIAVKNILDNPRLEDFNEGILITLLGSSWFGTNAKEMLAVAIEHPPTWVSIVYSSFVERSFKNSAIAKISERYGLKKGQTDFTRALVSLVHQYTE